MSRTHGGIECNEATSDELEPGTAPEAGTPFFSVVIPVFNCEQYIGECLTSLKHQTFPHFEALIVDDASTDNSWEVAHRAVGDDTRFRFMRLPENSGPATARNHAIDHAKGEVLVFLDSDDLLTPNALELMEERFTRQQLDDLYFNAKSFFEDAASQKLLAEDFSGRDRFDGVASGCELFVFFEDRDQFYIHVALRAIRRDLLEREKIRFPEGIIHEDVLFTFQTLLASKRSSFLHDQIYRRRIRAGSIMAKPRRTVRNIEGHLVGMRFMQQYLIDHASQLDENFIRAMSHRLNIFFDLCARDWLFDITEDEKAEFLAKLSPDERVTFQIEVAQRAEMLRDFYNSTTWKVGHAAIALPQALRDKIVAIRRRRG